ncbi:unnamed protein product, partial [marine sediment metagenome]
DTNAVSAFLAPGLTYWLVGEGSNHPFKATMGKTEDTYSQTLPTYPDAPPTEDALIRVKNEYRVTIIYGELPQKLPETL